MKTILTETVSTTEQQLDIDIFKKKAHSIITAILRSKTLQENAPPWKLLLELFMFSSSLDDLRLTRDFKESSYLIFRIIDSLTNCTIRNNKYVDLHEHNCTEAAELFIGIHFEAKTSIECLKFIRKCINDNLVNEVCEEEATVLKELELDLLLIEKLITHQLSLKKQE